MTEKNAAITQIIKAMQRDAEDVMNQIDLAAGDIGEGRRNGAVGALAALDMSLERRSIYRRTIASSI
ncbi:hypothetical protein [Shinella sp. HZN7]|uniref:hypothetical protein n=1 Tax=Shinella sp. (strain HZN7) TaxID=879274 RepID=UPI0007DA8BD4|nr:hypothetical protein [Shinella sp. HZN7]ANH05173.1 hypothetical protein shn_14800 [Shinella sp. HZN7]